jgi:hypothetical protein
MMGLLTDKPTPVIAAPKIDSLEHYFADDAATDALARAESDHDAARDALLIAAEYIRRGEALPGNLADHIAGAIEAAMVKPQKVRAKALTDKLHLTANNRKPKKDYVSIGAEIERHISKHSSEDKALLDICEIHNIGKSTAWRYWQDYQSASKKEIQFRRTISKGEGLLKET